MSLKSSNKTEVNTTELVISIDPAAFEAAVEQEYQRQKKNIQIKGFRKGKVSRKLAEREFGEGAFYEGAIEPFASQFSEVMTKMLFTLRERSQGNLIVATSNRLQYMSNADKLNVSAQMLDRGIMSLNDVRALWNLPPVEGGDVRIIRGEYYNADDKTGDTGGEDNAE